MTCSEEGCDEASRARGFCTKHYGAWYRRTHPARVARSDEKSRAKRKEYHRSYYLANRERVLERTRKYREAGGDEGRRKRAKQQRERRWADLEQDRLTQRRSRVKREYGLTLEEYDAILARGCAICGTRKGRVVGKRGSFPAPDPRLCIDHDHANGKVRAALCHSCNTGLGSFGDDPSRLRAAAEYIEAHQ